MKKATINQSEFTSMLGMSPSIVPRIRDSAQRSVRSGKACLYCGSFVPIPINYQMRPSKVKASSIWDAEEVKRFLREIDPAIMAKAQYKFSRIDYSESNPEIPDSVKRAKRVNDEYMKREENIYEKRNYGF